MDRRTPSTKRAVFWQGIGGRKQFNAYLFATLLTIMAFAIDGATFEAYALWLAAGLLTTSAIHAVEDRAKIVAKSQPATGQEYT